MCKVSAKNIELYYQIITKSVHKKNNFISTTQATLKKSFSQDYPAFIFQNKMSLAFAINDAKMNFLLSYFPSRSKAYIIQNKIFKNGPSKVLLGWYLNTLPHVRLLNYSSYATNAFINIGFVLHWHTKVPNYNWYYFGHYPSI